MFKYGIVKVMRKKAFTPIFIIIGVIVLLLLLGAVYIRSKIQPQTPATIQQPTFISSEARAYLFFSLDNKYAFYFYPDEKSEDKCNYYLRDMEGKKYDITSLIGSEQLDCREGEGYHLPSIIGWVDGQRLVFEFKKGTVMIVDIKNQTTGIWVYDVNTYYNPIPNKNLKYWLLQKPSGEQVGYALLDSQKRVVLDNLTFERDDEEAYGIFTEIYDPVNDGFLFASRKYSGKTVSIKFDFLSLSNLKLKEILTTDPVEYIPRGCGAGKEQIFSVREGEIIVEGKCLPVADKYRGLDTYIHLYLTSTIPTSKPITVALTEQMAQEVVNLLKDKNWKKLADFVHPIKGVRFSPYTYIDIKKDLVFTKEQIITLVPNSTIYNWGNYDGSGLPINLTFSEYYHKFIYDQDFASSREVSINKPIGRGNTINNILEVYPKASYIEYHYSRSSQMEGMDWSSLRLVFERIDNGWYLVGIVHDQWTI